MARRCEAQAGDNELVSADPDVAEKPRVLGPRGNPLFDGGRAAANSTLAPESAKFPLILLSHGTGGIAGSLAWLGIALPGGRLCRSGGRPPGQQCDRRLYGRGLYVVVGAGPRSERGDRRHARRANLLWRIDAQRIGAAGFSLGGYTMIAIDGGLTSLTHLREFCASPQFGDLRAKANALVDNDAQFRAALDNDNRPFRDQRVRAAFTMAPALGPAFLPESLERINSPVAIVAGAADAIAPV